MTFDREPDLDNANVGMPDTRILVLTKYTKEVTMDDKGTVLLSYHFKIKRAAFFDVARFLLKMS